jgi:hypothetical protein
MAPKRYKLSPKVASGVLVFTTKQLPGSVLSTITSKRVLNLALQRFIIRKSARKNMGAENQKFK